MLGDFATRNYKVPIRFAGALEDSLYIYIYIYIEGASPTENLRGQA